MNIAENIVRLQERLVERKASTQTIRMLDRYRSLAEQAGGNEHSSQLRVLHRLMRSPEATRDTSIYNDLAGLEEELEVAREEIVREKEALEARPMPKLKKYYKQQKNRKS